MESTGTCVCDSSDPTDPTEYLEKLKKKYITRTAKLQSQQQELEKKIIKMEMFIAKSDSSHHSPRSNDNLCICSDTPTIPKIFPEAPVRDISAVLPKNITSVIHEPQPPISQPCSFFQKIMDNAKSILSITCQCPSVVNRSTNVTRDDGTTTDSQNNTTEATTSVTRETEKTSSELPTTKESEYSGRQKVEQDTTLTEKSSKTSTCSCDEFTDSQQDVACYCEVTEQEAGEQVSMDQTTTSKKNTDSLTSKSDKCPWKVTPTSVLISGDCSCDSCTCDSAVFLLDDQKTVPKEKLSSIGEKHSEKVIRIEDAPSPSKAQVQVAARGENKEIYSQTIKDSVSKCVTCCQLPSCPTYNENKVDNLSAGIQVASYTQSKGIQMAKMSQIICNCSELRLSSVRETGSRYVGNKTRQDGENQCAFIGSPLLDDVFGAKSKVPCDCNTRPDIKQICQTSIASLSSADIAEMQNIADMAKREKEMKAQIQDLQRREQQYQQATKNVENVFTRTSNLCCTCPPSTKLAKGVDNEIEKISQNLRLENEMLKSELEDIKLELRHCLEKIEGPMKMKLQTEKQKCENLQKELQNASKDMLLNQDVYSREMNQLKLQLCCACSNITELNQMNQRLKDEMSQLDCLCQKLEDDLIKQKVNEAETIKRLTKRRPGGDAARNTNDLSQEDFTSDSNLDVIARKLSKTIKELAPCEECSRLPVELPNAAKCIKDLTDMVQKRKVGRGPSAADGCNCQSDAPSKEGFIEEECCDCCHGDGERTEGKKSVKTLLSIQKGESSKFDVDIAQSSYYSAKGGPCAKFGTPCVHNKGTVAIEGGQFPCSHIGQPCKQGEDQIIPVKDQGIQEVPKDEKQTETVGDIQDTAQDEVLEESKQEQEKIATTSSSEKRDILDTTHSIIVQIPEKSFETDEVQKVVTLATEQDKAIQPQRLDLESCSCSDNLNTDPKSEARDAKCSCSFFNLETRDEKPKEDDGGADEFYEEPKGLVEGPSEVSRTGESYKQPKELPEGPSEYDGADGFHEKPKGLAEGPSEVGGADRFYEQPREPAEGPSENVQPEVFIGPREIPFEEYRYGGEFPTDVVNKAYAIDESPQQLHMTTTVTESGTLEVVTEGPSGMIETFLKYTDDGNIEVVTAMTDAIDKFASHPPGGAQIACEPGSICHSMEELSGYEICDEEKICHQLDKKQVPKKVAVMPVESSMISGVSFPEAETSFTASSGYEADLTSKLATDSSGIRSGIMDRTHDLTSAFGESSAPTELQDFSRAPAGILKEDAKEGVVITRPKPIIKAKALQGELEEEFLSHEEFVGRPKGLEEEDRQQDRQIIEAQKSEMAGLPSTAAQDISEADGGTSGELKSGDIFTPEQAISDMEEEKAQQPPPTAYSPELLNEAFIESFIENDKEEMMQKSSPAQSKKQVLIETAAEIKDLEVSLEKEEELERLLNVAFIEPSSETKLPEVAPEGLLADTIKEASLETKQPSVGMEEVKASQIMGAPIVSEPSGELVTPTHIIGALPSMAIVSESVEIEMAEVSSEAVTALQVKKTIEESKQSGGEEVLEEKVVQEGEPCPPEIISKDTRKTRDCGCQSKDQTDQSCQCCECKAIGVSTSGDKETITEQSKEMGKTPKESTEEAKTDTDSEFVSISEILENVIVKALDTHTQVEPQDKEITILTALEKQPELHGKTSQEQEKILKDLGYLMPVSSKFSDSARLIEITDDLLNKHPELATMSKTEQQILLKSMGYIPSTVLEEAELPVTEELLAKHPELATLSKIEQQKALKSMGYTPPPVLEEAEFPIPEELLAKHPELAIMTKIEQQKSLKSMGYTPSTVLDKAELPITEELLAKHPELATMSKVEQQKSLKSMGYTPLTVLEEAELLIPEELLTKHPELATMSKIEQRKSLKSMGYTPSTVLEEAELLITEKLLTKHPELATMSKIEQQKSLKSLGYKQPSAHIPVSLEILQKHPELAGKSSTEQQTMLKDLGYVPQPLSKPPETIIDYDPTLKSSIKKSSDTKVVKSISFVPPAIFISESKPSRTVTANEELLEKHPELIGKTTKEQQQILKELGYYIPEKGSQLPIPLTRSKSPPQSTIINEELLKQYPELIGKTSTEQKEFLKNVPLKILASELTDQTLLKASSEFRKSQEQTQDAEDAVKPLQVEEEIIEPVSTVSDSQYISPEQSSKDVSITCKAPCRTTGTPAERKPPKTGSSITCRAPCRSRATINSITPTQSSKKIDSIGDVSSQQQQRPQSRDGSASAKASVKTISVQSSKTKEIKELVAARSDTTTTSSSMEEKEKTKKKTKTSVEEVPSIVSQLSDKERPALKSTSTKKPRTTRTKHTKANDCMKCVCKDSCGCEICTAKESKKRSSKQQLKRSVRSCDCPPNMVMVPQMIVMPPMQMTYSMPPTGHATNCRCNSCVYQEKYPSKSNVKGRNEADTSTATDDRRTKKKVMRSEADTSTATDDPETKKKVKHLSSCECIDCLCLPKIRELANTKEYPVVYDTKQIYQVKVKCETCTNAQKARRYLEQQEATRSRIPIPTNTASRPLARSIRHDADESLAGPSTSGSVYGSVSCDCEKCNCDDCPDEAINPKTSKVAKSPTKRSGGIDAPSENLSEPHPNCCCKVNCVCENCIAKAITKQLKDCQEALAAKPALEGVHDKPTLPPSDTVQHDEPCNCVICNCPRNDLMPNKAGGSVPGSKSGTDKEDENEEPCLCAPCDCPGADMLDSSKSKPKPSSDVHPPDCECSTCNCEGIENYRNQVKQSGSQPLHVGGPGTTDTGVDPKPGDPGSGIGEGDEECVCQPCECPGYMNLPPKKPSQSAHDSSKAASGSCDCIICKCGPCEDPKIKHGEPSGADASGQHPEEGGPGHPPSGDGHIPQVHKPGDFPSKADQMVGVPSVTDKSTKPEPDPHPENCDCDECKCLEEIIQTDAVKGVEQSVQPSRDNLLECICADKCHCIECVRYRTTHGEVCNCGDCKCRECPEMHQAGKPPTTITAGTKGKQDHPADCTCKDCECDICGDDFKSTLDKKQHDKSKCLCGDKCNCTECAPKFTHGRHCKCVGECHCTDCHTGVGLTTSDYLNTFVTAGGSGGKGSHHGVTPGGDEVSHPGAKPGGKGSDDDEKPPYLTPTGSFITGCRCKPCKCLECFMKESQKIHKGGCPCATCKCLECLKKQADYLNDNDECTCTTCTCPEAEATLTHQARPLAETTISKGKISSEKLKELNVLEGHPLDCTCTTCTCSECKAQPPSKEHQIKPPISHSVPEISLNAVHPPGCICKACICVECKGQQEQKESEQHAPKVPEATAIKQILRPYVAPPGLAEVPSVKKKCSCIGICDCKPCFGKETPKKDCDCEKCDCVICSKKLSEGAKKPTRAARGDGSHVETGTHSPTCTCPDCQCGPGPQPKYRGNLGGEIDLHDPPPFELFDRIDCDCKKCNCIICEERKKLGAAFTARNIGTHQSHLGMMPSTYVAPPFEIPIRVNCDRVCKPCTCIFCNKEGPPQVSVGAQQSGAFTQQQQQLQQHQQNVVQQTLENPITQAVRSTHSYNCTCPVCTCEIPGLAQVDQVKFASQTGTQYQASSHGKTTHGPSYLNVPPGVSSHVVSSVKPGESFMSAQESKTITQQKSVTKAKSVHCDCPTCTCEESKFQKFEPPKMLLPSDCHCPTCTCEEDIIKSTILQGMDSGQATSRPGPTTGPATSVQGVYVDPPFGGAGTATSVQYVDACQATSRLGPTTGTATSTHIPNKPAATETSTHKGGHITPTIPVTTVKGVTRTEAFPAEVFHSADTLILPQPDLQRMYPEYPPTPALCDCPPGRCLCNLCNDKTIQSQQKHLQQTDYIQQQQHVGTGSHVQQHNVGTYPHVQLQQHTGTGPEIQQQHVGTIPHIQQQQQHVGTAPHVLQTDFNQSQVGTHTNVQQQAELTQSVPQSHIGTSVNQSVKTMDDLTLVKSIEAANKENCQCKEQIEEIKKTLHKIRCACNEAEYRSAQKIIPRALQEVGVGAGHPLVKQASPFGQTMSGLQMALNNLQAKCKAKDKMIEAMTAELVQRGNAGIFDKVLDKSVHLTTALDYDQAGDVKLVSKNQISTNVLFGPQKVKHESTVPIGISVASKGVEVRSHKHKKKPLKEQSKIKPEDCECAKPQITQVDDKDCRKIDLTGFEVVDIRRITDDSLIVKWNAPKSNLVQGYDIYVNGTIATKVMSGTRTSAMMHSLDLTKSVQITIYAVTRCGRIDPPAIAIYEIKGDFV